MEQQRYAIDAGFDLSDLDTTKWPWYKMEQQILTLNLGCDLFKLDTKLWTMSVNDVQIKALRKGVDLSKLDDIDIYLHKDHPGYELDCRLDKILEERGK